MPFDREELRRLAVAAGFSDGDAENRRTLAPGGAVGAERSARLNLRPDVEDR